MTAHNLKKYGFQNICFLISDIIKIEGIVITRCCCQDVKRPIKLVKPQKNPNSSFVLAATTSDKKGPRTGKFRLNFNGSFVTLTLITHLSDSVHSALFIHLKLSS